MLRIYSVAHAVYQLPFGRNKRWGKNLNSFVNAVIGNWQVGSIVQAHGGFPLTIFSDDASGTNSRGSRANCNAPPHVFGRKPAFDASSGQFIGFQWFDPASYGPAVPGTFGTCGVGTVRGPGLRTADLSVQKEFPLSESKSVGIPGRVLQRYKHSHFEFSQHMAELQTRPGRQLARRAQHTVRAEVLLLTAACLVGINTHDVPHLLYQSGVSPGLGVSARLRKNSKNTPKSHSYSLMVHGFTARLAPSMPSLRLRRNVASESSHIMPAGSLPTVHRLPFAPLKFAEGGCFFAPHALVSVMCLPTIWLVPSLH